MSPAATLESVTSGARTIPLSVSTAIAIEAQALQEEFGPHIGASPVALLSVIGRNMVGRLKVAHPGVLPKFLDVEKQKKAGLGKHPKATLLTHRHIVKGSSSRLPFATANEYLCMQVVASVLPTAKTELSEDGNVLAG